MNKYKVRIYWSREIDFGIIEAESKDQAEEMAREEMANNSDLVEEDFNECIEIIKVKE